MTEQAAKVMPSGYEQVVFEAHGRRFAVRRLVGHRPAVYHLRDLAITSRSRFGSREEIIADVASCLEVGALPGGNKGRW